MNPTPGLMTRLPQRRELVNDPGPADGFRVRISTDKQSAVLTFTDEQGTDTQIIMPGDSIVAFAMQLMKAATDQMVRQYCEANRAPCFRDQTVLSSAVGVVTSKSDAAALVIQTSDHYQIRVGVTAGTLSRLATELARLGITPTM